MIVREPGPRELYEMSRNELAAVCADLRRRRRMSPDESLMRDVLEVYDLQRLTAKTHAYLQAALELAEE